jgi:hypothetical protein
MTSHAVLVQISSTDPYKMEELVKAIDTVAESDDTLSSVDDLKQLDVDNDSVDVSIQQKDEDDDVTWNTASIECETNAAGETACITHAVVAAKTTRGVPLAASFARHHPRLRNIPPTSILLLPTIVEDDEGETVPSPNPDSTAVVALSGKPPSIPVRVATSSIQVSPIPPRPTPVVGVMPIIPPPSSPTILTVAPLPSVLHPAAINPAPNTDNDEKQQIEQPPTQNEAELYDNDDDDDDDDDDDEDRPIERMKSSYAGAVTKVGGCTMLCITDLAARDAHAQGLNENAIIYEKLKAGFMTKQQ